MGMSLSNLQYYSVLQDFRRTRRRADLEQIITFLKGKSASLLPYEDVRRKLTITGSERRELQEVSLDAIVGSVSRYHDFTRGFLPKHEREKERWATIETLVNGAEGGLPPIELYQIGNVYFVYDGNHRVSVARQVGATLIEAYVYEIQTNVTISPDIQPDDMILKEEYSKFLARTHLNDLRRVSDDFQATVPGKYHILEEQIELHRYIMGVEQQRTISYKEAVTHWYDTIYLAIVQLIEELGILRDFPDRTATDLYLWISEHRSLVRQLGTAYNEAYVTEIWNKISVSSEERTDELIIHTEYHDFIEHTHVDILRPEADLRVTLPGKYRDLEEHIKVHRYFMGLEQKREIRYSEAVTHWYDGVYLPFVRVIREQQILEEFPGRTETDLYLWLSEHRTVSRQVDTSHTEVYLSEIWMNTRTLPYVHLDELIVKVEYVDFLAHTGLHELRPKADLMVSTPGKYRVIEEHIDVHRYFMGVEQKREIPYAEAVVHWYDTVYCPILDLTVEQRILRDFPDLTATDLYLWLSEHQSVLKKQVGHQVSLEAASADLVYRFGSKKSSPIFSRLGKKLLDVIIPGKQEEDISARQQRKIDLAERRKEHLFTEILVPINGQKHGWHVLEQALEIARREDAYVTGLHVVSSEHLRYKETTLMVKDHFDQRCNVLGIQGTLIIEIGDIVQKICEYACGADLVILHAIHVPNVKSVPKLHSEFRAMNRRCSCSILALPEEVSPLNRALLVYDGTQKSNEALFASTYLAGCWGMSLVILTENIDAQARSFVKSYFKRRNVEAAFVQQRGTLKESLPKIVRESNSDVIIIGGYGEHPIWEFIFGRPVDQVLGNVQKSVLICR